MDDASTKLPYTNWSKELSQKGYLVAKKVLDRPLLESLRSLCDEALSSLSKDNFGESGAFVAPDYTNTTLVTLLTWPRTIEILKLLGFPNPKLHNFYISAKPPGAKPLAWHSDLFYECEESLPAELFLIYYLEDTSPQNGCLRVVPGSHKWHYDIRRRRIHNAHPREDEVDVALQAGDLFIGDRRILHATHANVSDSWRTCLTIAYAPKYFELPEPIQSLIVQNQCLPSKGWWKDQELIKTLDKRLQAILPIYEGKVSPISIE